MTDLEPADEKWVFGVYGCGNRGDLEVEAVDVGVGGEEGGEVVGFGGGDGWGGSDEGYGAVVGGEGGGEREEWSEVAHAGAGEESDVRWLKAVGVVGVQHSCWQEWNYWYTTSGL